MTTMPGGVPTTPEATAAVAPISMNMHVKTTAAGGPVIAFAFDGEKTFTSLCSIARTTARRRG